METSPISSTGTIIKALRILARDIQSEDGVANMAIAEAADRLQVSTELNELAYDAIAEFKDVIILLRPDFENFINRWMAQVDKLK